MISEHNIGAYLLKNLNYFVALAMRELAIPLQNPKITPIPVER